nr:FRAS1-related extracellular matrix protein 1-like [Misgurnus anguillicaudatus]
MAVAMPAPVIQRAVATTTPVFNIPTPDLKMATAHEPVHKMSAVPQSLHKMAASPVSPVHAKTQQLMSSLLDTQMMSVRVAKIPSPVMSSSMVPMATEPLKLNHPSHLIDLLSRLEGPNLCLLHLQSRLEGLNLSLIQDLSLLNDLNHLANLNRLAYLNRLVHLSRLVYLIHPSPLHFLLWRHCSHHQSVTLMEGERVILTTDILMATDSGSPSDELIYTVSTPPEHGHLHNGPNSGGSRVHLHPNGCGCQPVCYTHDNSRFADRDSFSFAITNGVTSRTGSIYFTVEHSDRIPPTLNINKGLQLTEGTVKIISNEHLKLTDPDTALDNLTYVVIQGPQYGKLLLKGFPLSKPRFTQVDINSMDITYHHLNGRAKIDRFTFQPTDGTNTGYLEYGQLKTEPAVFTIQIEILDKTPPNIVHRGVPSTVESIQDGKQCIYITTKELQATDPDSPDDALEFTIIRPPHFGYFENALTGAYIKGRFTQKDVNQKAVRYVIPVDIEVTADSFEFQVTDPAGNTMLPEVLEFRWSRVELSASCYRVCENAGTLGVQVVRSGNSIDPAYVGIQVEEGTAKVGKDFTHSSASLVQFDPGVYVKIWNIHLKDDGLEENHEKFEVVLKTPKNAVLGQRNKATVEIVDPRNDREAVEGLLPGLRRSNVR